MRPCGAVIGGNCTIPPRRRQSLQRRNRRPSSTFSTSAASTPSTPSNDDPTSTSTPSKKQYRYVDAQGKRKATIQDASPSLRESTKGPWELGFQLPERDNALWNSDLRRRLIRHALSSQFGSKAEGQGLVLTEAEIDERLTQLTRLLPGLAPRLASTSASILAKMVENPAAVAATLVSLRSIFPRADVGKMVSRAPALALAGSIDSSGLEALGQSRAKLLELLPNLDVDAAVSDHPSLLDHEGVASALEEARRILGEEKFDRSAFEREPSLVFRFQHGDLLIPYDQFEKDGTV